MQIELSRDFMQLETSKYETCLKTYLKAQNVGII